MPAKMWDEYVSFVNTYYAVQERCEELRSSGIEVSEGLRAFCHDANPFLWDSESSADPTVYGNFSSSFYVQFSGTKSTAEDALAFCRNWLDRFGTERYQGALLDSFDSVVDSLQTWESAYAPIKDQLDLRARINEWSPQDEPAQLHQEETPAESAKAEPAGDQRKEPQPASVQQAEQSAEAQPEPATATAQPAAPTAEAPVSPSATAARHLKDAHAEAAPQPAARDTASTSSPTAPSEPPATAVAHANPTAPQPAEAGPATNGVGQPQNPQQEESDRPQEAPLPQNVLRLNVHAEAAPNKKAATPKTSVAPGARPKEAGSPATAAASQSRSVSPAEEPRREAETVVPAAVQQVVIPSSAHVEKAATMPASTPQTPEPFDASAETFVAPGAPPEVSKASLSDTDAIASLLAMDDPLLARTLEEFFMRGMQCGTVVELVVRIEGEVVACAGLTFVDLMPTVQNPSGVCAVVSGLAARHGYSNYLQLLLKAIEKKTLARGVGELTLLDSSARSVEACERYGFRLEGSRLVMHL